MYKVHARIEGCETKTYMKCVHLPYIGLPLEDQFYWNNCQCNEYDGLTRRHLLGYVAGYQPGNQELKTLEKHLIQMASVVPAFGRVDHKTLLDNTRSTIKSRYKRAYYMWRTQVVNLDYRQSEVKAFVKYEKIPIGKYYGGKPPRMIQFRDFTYLYCLKRELLPFSQLVKTQSIQWFTQELKTIFTKVHDNYGIAKVLYDSWKGFTSPVAVCLDHSKFDGHYCQQLLSLETNFWTTLNNSRMLRWLLSEQFVNRGRTPHGVKYKCKGGRMSGEYTTSDGNSIMNYAMLYTWVKQSGLADDKFRIHVNGDDSVIIMEYEDHVKLPSLDYFRNFNMETECDRIVTDFRNISYCQASPIRVVKEGELCWYMVKEPVRTISRMCYADSKFEPALHRYVCGVGLCELAVNSGIPITQALALWLISEGSRPLGCVDKYPALNSGNDVEYKDIHPITRTDYEVAFGIDHYHQQHLERLFAGAIRSTQDLSDKLTRYKLFHKN